MYKDDLAAARARADALETEIKRRDRSMSEVSTKKPPEPYSYTFGFIDKWFDERGSSLVGFMPLAVLLALSLAAVAAGHFSAGVERREDEVLVIHEVRQKSCEVSSWGRRLKAVQYGKTEWATLTCTGLHEKFPGATVKRINWKILDPMRHANHDD